MFTGIVEELGSLSAIEHSAGQARLVISAAAVLDGTRVGDSIAVNGCCLTVVDHGPDWWAADAVAETLGRTNLGQLQPGDSVNLERAMAVGDRLGGHIVQGHVDCTGRVVQAAPDLRIATSDDVRPYLVDGVSLTVVSALEDGFTVAVIPHTMAVTTLGLRRPGDLVNIEADVIAKYTEGLLRAGVQSPYAAHAAGRGA